MHRERSFRVWRPKIKCECDHPLEICHPLKGACRASGCGCKKFTWKKKANKYQAKKQEFGGILYHSGLEAKVAADLDFRKRSGDIAEIKRQVRMPLEVNGRRIGNYLVDFLITHNDGTQEYIEVKGYPSPLGEWKMKHFEAQYADGKNVKYSVVRQ